MPIFLEALTLAILGTPVQAKAAASSHLNNSTSDFAQRLIQLQGKGLLYLPYIFLQTKKHNSSKSSSRQLSIIKDVWHKDNAIGGLWDVEPVPAAVKSWIFWLQQM